MLFGTDIEVDINFNKKDLPKLKRWALNEIKEWKKFIKLLDKQLKKK